MNTLFNALIHLITVVLFSPLLFGVIAKVKALVGGKVGPPVCQPYFDIWKLLHKKCVYSRTTTWVFRITPLISLAAMLTVALFVPIASCSAPFSFSGDIFLVVYLLALVRFFMISAALDTGSSFEGMGAAREAFFSCLSELALFINLITLAQITQSVSLSRMIGADVPLLWGAVAPSLILVVASFFIVLLAENCRIPVDDPDTHLELTMIHEVMILDHSGVDLAYLLYASAVKFFLFISILLSLLFSVQTGNYFWRMILFMGGAIGLAVLVGLIESSMARLRMNRIKNLLLISFVLSFFALIVTLWRA